MPRRARGPARNPPLPRTNDRTEGSSADFSPTGDVYELLGSKGEPAEGDRFARTAGMCLGSGQKECS